MSDLISRREVNDVIDELEVYTYGRPNTMKVEVSVLQLQRLINKLKNIPTVYDIDKVVEELWERTDFLKDCTKYGNKNAEQQAESYSTMMMYEVADLVDDLTEIVKHGGVSDDVCEWELDSHLENDTPAEWLICPHSPKKIFSTDIKYCPFCGKKIKVVE